MRVVDLRARRPACGAVRRRVVRAALTVGVLTLVSCGPDLYDFASETSTEPVITEPTVASFQVERAIWVSWTEDPGADEYVLYRDEDYNGSFSNAVYAGSDLEYVDSELDEETLYYYRLAKRRGRKEFPKSDYVLGVAGLSSADDFEDNDRKSSAKPWKQPSTSANIYFYRDAAGNTVSDTDWYSVELAPNRILIIQVAFTSGSNLIENDLWFLEDGRTPQQVSNSDITEFSIENDGTTEKTVRFAVYPNEDVILGSPSAAGGKFGDYKIEFVQEQPTS